MSRAARHTGNTRKRRMLLAAGSASLALALVIALAALYARPLLAGPALTQLEITGKLEHVSPQSVRAAVRPQVGSGFFTTDVNAVRSAVAALPWVEAVSVRRGWPHTLYIDIDEEVPAARWNGAGLVDAQGHVFALSGGQDWAQLPGLSGPDGSAASVMTDYRSFDSMLAATGLSVRRLDVDARGAATLTLNDGISLRLGRQQADRRLERFASVALPVLKDQLANVAYVDMRYTNGFAVGWSRMISATCQWHVAPAKRRHMDVAAGRPAMDGLENCTSTCAAAGQPAMDGSRNCSAPCTALDQSSAGAVSNRQAVTGSQACNTACTSASRAVKGGSAGVCTTSNEVQANG